MAATQRALTSLPRGPITDREIGLLGALRGPVTAREEAVLRAPQLEVLRDPARRVRVLDLLRLPGALLRFEVHPSVLPLLAGIAWVRPPVDLVVTEDLAELARHLLCVRPVPAFLCEPFEHPERYFPGARWWLARLLAAFGGGADLDGLREGGLLPGCLTHGMFRTFLRSADGTPVMIALRQAQVAAFDGPPWLGAAFALEDESAALTPSIESAKQHQIAWLCAQRIEEGEFVRLFRYLRRGHALGDRTSTLAAAEAWHERQGWSKA